MPEPIIFGLAENDTTPLALRRNEDFEEVAPLDPELESLGRAFLATRAAAERGAADRGARRAREIETATADLERRNAAGRAIAPRTRSSHLGMQIAEDAAAELRSPLRSETVSPSVLGLAETQMPAAAPAPGHSEGVEAYRVSKMPGAQRFAHLSRLREPGDRSTTLGEIGRSFASDVVPAAVEGIAGLFGSREDAARAESAARAIGQQAITNLDTRVRPLLDIEYDPVALGSSLVPFADELYGAASAALSDDPNDTYRSEQTRLQGEFDRARARSPGSALAGSVLQGVALTPFLPVPAGARATLPATASAGQQAARGAFRAGVEGAELGALTGLDRSRHGVLRDVTDLARGRLTRGPLAIANELGGALGDTARDAAIGGAVGTGLGSLFGTAQGLVARRLSRPVATRQNAAEVARIRRAIEASDSAPDELAVTEMLGNETPTGLDELPASVVGAEIPGASRVNAADLVPERNLTLSQMMRNELAGADPDMSRLRAMGLQTVGQLRGARNVFGPRGLSRRADMYGIMREGEIGSTDTFIRRAEALRENAGAQLRALADRARRDGVMIDGDALAEEMIALADEYSAIRDADMQAIGARIREQARLIRPDVLPEEAEALIAATTPEGREAGRIAAAEARALPEGADSTRRTMISDIPDEVAAQIVAQRRFDRANTIPEWSQFEGATLPETGPTPGIARDVRTAPARRSPVRPADQPPLPAEEPTTMLDEEPLGLVDDADVEMLDSGEMPAGLADSEGVALTAPPSRPAMAIRSPTFVPWDEMQQILRAQSGRNRGVYSGSVTNPQEAHLSGTQVYRLLNRARDRAIGERYGADELARYRALRDQYATAATIAPADRNARIAMTAPTLRSALFGAAGMASGNPLGFVAGHFAGRVLPRYEYSILAALNADARGSLAAAAAGQPPTGSVFSRVPGLADLGMRIESAIARDPQAFAQYSATLRDDIARLGTIRALQELYERDPDAAEAIEAQATGRQAPQYTDFVTDRPLGEIDDADDEYQPMIPEDDEVVPDEPEPEPAPAPSDDSKDPSATDEDKRRREGL